MSSDKKIAASAAKLVADPRFLYLAGKKILELGMVGEERNGVTIFLAGLTAFLKTKVSVAVTGPSGSGKSTTIEIPLRLFPPELVIRRASFSPRAFAYGEESLDGKLLYVNEYRGGRDSQLLLRILQSEGEIVHEYTKGARTEVTRRLGSPVVFTTTTLEDMIEDDATRFLRVPVDETPDQTLAVLKATIGTPTMSSVRGLEVFQQAIRMLGERAKGSFTFPAFLDYVAEQVPRDRARTRRDWKRFIGIMQAVALCRPPEASENAVTPADYCVAYRILNMPLTATVYAINENVLNVWATVARLFRESKRGIEAKQIMADLGWGKGMTYRYVKQAVDDKLIRRASGSRERNRKPLFPVAATVNSFLPSPRRLPKNVKGLGNSVQYIDPYTGKLIKVRAAE